MSFVKWEQTVEPFYATHDSSHDVEHARAVARITRSLCITSLKVNRADTEIAVGAAWVHDVLDAKYNPDPETRAALIQSIHAAALLNKSDAERCVYIGERISFSKRVKRKGAPPTDLNNRDTLLYLYVSDADMLEAMGAVGVIRTCVYQSIHCTSDSLFKDALDYADTVLVDCKKYMHHPDAKAEAERRLTMMRLLIQTIRHERAWEAPLTI